MVRKIPGFSINEAEEKRGLGQGGSNVLINGERFSGKSNDVVSELGRISASDVLRIELVDGATLNIPGLSGQVVNIIAETSSFSGQFRWTPSFRFRHTEPRLLEAEVSVTGKTGKLGYSFSLSNDSFRNGNAGPETVLDGNGLITDIRDEVLFVYGDRPRVSAGLKYNADNGAIANLNLVYERYYFEIRELSDGAFVRDRDFFETEKEYNYELGGDYEFPLGGGKLKLIGLHRFEHSPFFTDFVIDFEDGRPDEGLRQRRTTDETESIARAEYSWNAGRSDWQLSLEGALNSLDNQTVLEVLNANGGYDPIPLPGANASVEEKRAETAISFGRPLSSNLTFQTSIGAEYSKISQSGPAGQTRNFIRPNGFISFAWKPEPSLDLSARLQREVGQLNFFDFIASADIGAGNQNASNPDLVPQQSWNVELEATKNLGAYGSLNSKLFVNFIEDIVDQIPLDANNEAPGNIDKATVWGGNFNGTLKFDPMGFKGAQLEIAYNFRKSRLDDPLTGERRAISEENAHSFSLDFRHDIPKTKWAYGAFYNDFSQTANVRLNQITQFRAIDGDLGFFVENKDVFGLTIRGSLNNLLGTNESLSRTQYVGRRDGPILFTENRDRFFGPILRIDIKGSF